MKTKDLRLKNFLENVKPKIGFPIHLDEYKVVIDTNTFGTVDWFPKKNKLLIRKDNKWIENGNLWIDENLAK